MSIYQPYRESCLEVRCAERSFPDKGAPCSGGGGGGGTFSTKVRSLWSTTLACTVYISRSFKEPRSGSFLADVLLLQAQQKSWDIVTLGFHAAFFNCKAVVCWRGFARATAP